MIRRIEKRLSHVSFLPVENGEGLQILHYQVLCPFPSASGREVPTPVRHGLHPSMHAPFWSSDSRCQAPW